MAKPGKMEVEVSLFGPGVGESVVVHLGLNKWMIVDSCKDSLGNIVALNYLKSIGVDCSNDVKWIVVTHWDDDHIRGISDIIRECTSSKLAIAASFFKEDLHAYILARHERSPSMSSGVSELYDIVKYLTSKVNKKAIFTDYIPVIARGLLMDMIEDGLHIKVIALSPSPFTYQQFISRSFADENDINISDDVIASDRNDNSIALYICVGNTKILLGGDLPYGRNDQEGWRAILQIRDVAIEPSCIFKIPHHGSNSSYSKDIWGTLVNNNSIAMLTPKLSCRNPPPTTNGINNIKRHTSLLYSTCQISSRPPKRIISNAFEKKEISYIKDRRVVTGPIGHVCVRHDHSAISEEKHVSLMNGACKL